MKLMPLLSKAFSNVPTMDSFFHFRERIQTPFGEYITMNGNNKGYLWVNNEEIFCNNFQHF